MKFPLENPDKVGSNWWVGDSTGEFMGVFSIAVKCKPMILADGWKQEIFWVLFESFLNFPENSLTVKL